MKPQNSDSHSANRSPTKTVMVGDVRFTYREFGPAEGLPVIFLHHFTATLDDWDPRIIDAIAAKRRVITFDNRGIGGSEGKTPSSIAMMADDAIAFIQALKLEQVDLLGFSMGGFISQVIAAKNPELVRRIILAGTGPAGQSSLSKAPTMIGDLFQGLLTLKDPKRYLFFTKTANGKAAAAAFMNRLDERKKDRVRTTTPSGVLAQIVAIYRWGEQAPMNLATINHPVFVANGIDDRMIPTQLSRDLASRLPNAVLKIYPDSGHGGIFQHHDEFSADALDFLS